MLARRTTPPQHVSVSYTTRGSYQVSTFTNCKQQAFSIPPTYAQAHAPPAHINGSRTNCPYVVASAEPAHVQCVHADSFPRLQNPSRRFVAPRWKSCAPGVLREAVAESHGPPGLGYAGNPAAVCSCGVAKLPDPVSSHFICLCSKVVLLGRRA